MLVGVTALAALAIVGLGIGIAIVGWVDAVIIVGVILPLIVIAAWGLA